MANHPPKAEAYEQIDHEPDARWKPSANRSLEYVVMFSTPGNFYKLVRSRATGEVTYYRLRDMGPAVAPKEKIDAEPVTGRPKHQHVGSKCWYVENGKWFLVKVERPRKHAIVLRSETGQDADRQTPWPYGEALEVLDNSEVFKRLRPLRDRYA